MIAQNVKANLWVTDAQMGEVRSIIEDYASQEFPNQNKLFRDLKDKFGTHIEKVVDEGVKEVKNTIRKYRLNVSDTIKGDIADYNDVRRRNFGKVLFSRQGTPVDIAYEELSNMYPGYFPPDITNPTDQLWRIIDVANQSAESVLTHNIEDEYVWDVVNDIAEAVSDYQHIQSEKASTKKPEGYMEDLLANGDDYAPIRPPVETPPDLTAEEREYAPTYEALEREGVVGAAHSYWVLSRYQSSRHRLP